MNWQEMQLLDNPKQEEWFDIWANELVEAGYIDEVVTHPDVPTFELFPGLKRDLKYQVTNTKGTKEKVKEVTLMRPVAYTPDRIIKWNIKAKDVFFACFQTEFKAWQDYHFLADYQKEGNFYYSIIEVKGPTGSQKAYGSDFKFTQKWLWANTQQYVQKIMLAPAITKQNPKNYLWAMTFTPKRFLFSDKLSTNKNKPIPYRAIPNKKGVPHWEVRSLEEFELLKQQLT
jgi:hypothetical protein